MSGQHCAAALLASLVLTCDNQIEIWVRFSDIKMDALHFLVLVFFRIHYQRRCTINNRWWRMFPLLQELQRTRVLMTNLQTPTLAFLTRAYALRNQEILVNRPWMLQRPRLRWFELIMEDDSQSCFWKEHFRMRRKPSELVNLVDPKIARRNTMFWEAIPTHIRVAIALWRLAGWGSFRDIAAQLRSWEILLRKNHKRVLPNAE